MTQERTVNFTLRLPPGLAAALDVRAAQRGVSRSEYIGLILTDDALQSMAIAGVWQVYESEIDECSDCGQPLDPADTWLGATADGRMHGPMCGSCARSD
jgi:hypothetical protein